MTLELSGSLNLQIEICKNILESSGAKNGDRLTLIETMDPDFLKQKNIWKISKELIREPILLVLTKEKLQEQQRRH